MHVLASGPLFLSLKLFAAGVTSAPIPLHTCERLWDTLPLLLQDMHPALKSLVAVPARRVHIRYMDSTDEEVEPRPMHEPQVRTTPPVLMSPNSRRQMMEHAISVDMEWLGLWGKDLKRIPYIRARYEMPFERPSTPGNGFRTLFRAAWRDAGDRAARKVCAVLLGGMLRGGGGGGGGGGGQWGWVALDVGPGDGTSLGGGRIWFH